MNVTTLPEIVKAVVAVPSSVTLISLEVVKEDTISKVVSEPSPVYVTSPVISSIVPRDVTGY